MGKLNVYVPDELEAIIRQKELSPSVLLQDALQNHLTEEDRQELMDRWLADAAERNGPPTAEDLAWVEQVMAPIYEREA